MEEYDAFRSGVEFGGLVNTTEIRALICYMLTKLDPISGETLRTVFQEHGFANYFDVSEAISELIRMGNISVEYTDEGEERLVLTQSGHNVAWELSPLVPKTVREKALSAGLAAISRQKNAKENDVQIVPNGSGFNVVICVGAPNDALMRLTVYAADMTQATRMKDNYLKDPVKIYSEILASLIL
ncbi:MAG: DUF4364 family protein [Acutalibacteraceae bacterium]